ncbi:hypothetical protein Tco_1193473 [Tanacetum coccineum]
MPGDRSLLKNYVEKFMGTVRFGNDHFAAITGYGDYIQGNITISHVYYVEGLGHNLFGVGQFCDGDLEVAFHSNTCYVRNLEGDDLLTDAREFNLYTISISDMAASSPVCLLSKSTSTKSSNHAPGPYILAALLLTQIGGVTIGFKSQDSKQFYSYNTHQYHYLVEDDLDIGSPGVDGPPIIPEDPYAYIMAAYQVPPSPDYILGPEVPPSPTSYWASRSRKVTSPT